MGKNPIRFRVENDKGEKNFWYTLVAGNGNTTMTSKSTYDDYDTALRAARRQAAALQATELIVEFERDGEIVEESFPASGDVAEAVSPEHLKNGGKIVVPTPSFVPAQARLNPNF